MGPTLLRLLLIPPLAGLVVLALLAWLVAYPGLVADVVDRERILFEREGASVAADISQHAEQGAGNLQGALDHAAMGSAADHLMLVDAQGLILSANDVLLRDLAIDSLDQVPPAIRQAVHGDVCRTGLVIVDREHSIAGCWQVALAKRDVGIIDKVHGQVIIIRRIDWIMGAARADLINQSMRLGGSLVIMVALLLFLAVRMVLTPVATLSAGLAGVRHGHLLPAASRFAIREIHEFTQVLDNTLTSLRAREQEMQAILDTAVDGIITIRADGTIQQVNSAICRLFLYTPDQLIGQDVSILMTGGDARRHAGHVQHYLATGEAKIIGTGRELVARRRDSTTFMAWLSVARLELESGLHFTASIRDITAERMAEFELHRLAYHDPDLDLFNRRAWDMEVRGLLAGTADGTGFWVLLVVVRNLDDLIVTFGPAVEAASIGAVHRLIEQKLACGELSARLSRAVLAYAIPAPGGTPDQALVAGIAARLRDGVDLGGLSLFPDAQLIIVPHAQGFACADDLLQAQEAGRSWAMETAEQRATPIFTYDDQVAASIKERTAIATQLPGALARGLLYPVFQPQVRMADGVVRGVETLVRWRNPDGPGFGPAAFIPVAERIGLVGDIDQLVTRLSLDHLAAGRRGLGEGAVISINASVKELADPEWVDGLLLLAARAGVVTSRLEIEVTETAVMENLDRTALVLHDLRRRGVKVAIDDFGAGYASLSYLKHLPADILKIDQSFIRDLADNPRSRSIVAAIIDLAHQLDMEVVAEGVETAEIARILTDIGCDIGQGWYFARPMEPLALCAYLSAREV